MSEIIQYVVFCVWLLSLSMFLRFIHIDEPHISSSCLAMAKEHSIV